MTAIRICVTAAQDIFANPLTALKVTLPAILASLVSVYLIAILFEAVISTAAPTGEFTAAGAPMGHVSQVARAALIGGAVVILLFVLLGTSWSAVGLHRFVCLHEVPGTLLPRWHGRLVVRYAFRLVTMVLLLFALLFSLLFIVMGSGGLVDTDQTGEFSVNILSLPVPVTMRNLFVSLAIQGICLAVVLRASVWLPACALDRPIPRVSTPGAFLRTIFPVSFLLCALFLGLSLLVLLVPLGGFSQILLIWLQFMAMVGFVTRIYLHFEPETGDTPA